MTCDFLNDYQTVQECILNYMNAYLTNLLMKKLNVRQRNKESINYIMCRLGLLCKINVLIFFFFFFTQTSFILSHRL